MGDKEVNLAEELNFDKIDFQNVKKRDLTYDDMLESMNLKFVNGNLQYIQPTIKEKEKEKEKPVALTKYQYDKMMRENIQKRNNELIRIKQVKEQATKLFFTNNTIQNSTPFIKPKNHLFNIYSHQHPMKKANIIKKHIISLYESKNVENKNIINIYDENLEKKKIHSKNNFK